jgi:hypothetical protein
VEVSSYLGDSPVNLARKVWQRAKDLLPISGFHFDRPLLLLQSDDWGRAGLRDREGLEQLQSAGLELGERPYDFYGLETAEDLAALMATLMRHRDSVGRHPCVEMNFVLGNLDFARMEAEDWESICILHLAEGLPKGWNRPGLVEAYRSGISDGIFHPALHGTLHFCSQSVERNLASGGERAALLRTLWQAGTPYIHWRMPWIGYEYWDPEMPPDDRFLPASCQQEIIGQAVGAFAKLFSALPFSACAPGYRANDDTVRAWAQHGIRIAQNGPGETLPPYFDSHEVLQVFRTIEFEPAVDVNFSIEACLEKVEKCFEQGIPAIVSTHSINFHSNIRDFRSATLKYLDEFLSAISSKYSDLLYLNDTELHQLVQHGYYKTTGEKVRADVTRKKFTKAAIMAKG